MSVQFDSNRIRSRIRESLEKAYRDADPLVLDKYRSLFKGEVSLFKRSYFTAYLLMELDQRDGGRRRQEGQGRRRRGGEDSGGGRAPRDEPDAPRAYPLSEEESARLFVSAGRSRRVFPREILGLILSRTSVSREDIGAIRILDNYSFVQVRATAADGIIEALNGKPFRGRPLSVNYARTRKEGQDSPEPGDAGHPGGPLPRGIPSGKDFPEGDGLGAEDRFPEEDGLPEGDRFREGDGLQEEDPPDDGYPAHEGESPDEEPRGDWSEAEHDPDDEGDEENM